MKEHPELYDKEQARFHDRQKKEAIWAEISVELKLQPFDVRRWFESQRTRYGKLSKLQSGQAPREMTKRQSWAYQQMGFLKTQVRRKGASRSSVFEASSNTSKQDEPRGSTTDTEHLESSVLRESRSQPMFTSTPVSTDSKILEHFDQMRTLISGFLQQKSDRQPFFDYVASEAEKMTQEEFEDHKHHNDCFPVVVSWSCVMGPKNVPVCKSHAMICTQLNHYFFTMNKSSIWLDVFGSSILRNFKLFRLE